MKLRMTSTLACGWALTLSLALADKVPAATSFSNSLTGFSGDSTLAGTQAALAAAGFSAFSTAGLDAEFTMDPTVTFGAGGATFGSLFGGDGGRNYLRTTQDDYATVNFNAAITIITPNLAIQDVFFGLGAGETALFGVPDWSTQFSSVFVQPEFRVAGDPKLTTFRTQNDINEFVSTNAPALLNGTHRLQLAFNATAKTATFAIDVNYAGGAFVADATAATVDVSTLFAADGWPLEPSRIYFGGDDSATFKDFSVTVGNTPVEDADFDNDGDVDGRDFLIWQRGLGTGAASNLTGDANGSMTVDGADLAIWKDKFGGAAVTALGLVPEPSTAMPLVLGMLAAHRFSRGRAAGGRGWPSS